MAAASESVFVSYAGPDRAWAEWVAWHLREAGHRVELDVWDWQTGDNFIDRMNTAMQRATVVVALFSTSYFRSSRWTHEEWTSVVGRRERLVPLTVEPLMGTDIPPILTAVIRKDLHGLDEPAAIAALLNAVNGPVNLVTAPGFPGTPPLPNGSTPGPSSQRPRLPSATGIPQVWNVQRRNPHFTGRELLMTQVREGLLGGRQAVVQALHGLGGIGKTQIALEYAHRFASQYDTVWWIDAEQADQIPVRYAELATRLGIAKPEAGTEHNTRTLLEYLRTRDRWLIILDNADRPQDFENLIPTGSGHVLITSRNPDWNENVHSLNLGVFSRSDSLAYLTARLPGIASEQADALADDLGDLPLALAQAAGVISGGMTVDRYRRLLADKTNALMANGTPPGYSAPLAASVDIATTRLAAEHPGAAGLLRLGAFLGPDPVPTIWLEAVAGQLATVAVNPDDFMWPQAALQSLARYGLARVDYETFQIHRLTQAILRSQASKEEATASQDDVITILAAVAPGDPETPAAWHQWAAFTSHLSARHHTATDHPQLRQALVQAARYLIRSGQPGAARQLTSTLHRAWSSALGENHEDTLACAQYLSHSTSNLGEHVEARRMIEDTLQRRRHVLGDNHPDTLHSANDLGAALGRLGEHAEARRMDEGTLQRRRHVLGDNHPDTLQSAHNLAVTLNYFGEHAEARRMHEDTLQRRRHVLGDNHPDTLQSAHSLAVTLDALEEHAEARRMHEDTLQRRRHVLGDNHPDTLQSAHGLAVALNNLGEHAEARRMHEDTLQRRRHVLGDNHPDTLHSALSLAIALNNLGEHAEARRMHEDTLQRHRHVLGDNHPDTLHSAHNLAVTLNNLGEHAEARRMHEDTLQRRRHVLGDNHPDTLHSAHGLAVTLSRLREHAEAVRLLKDTRMRSRRTLGNEHRFTKRVTYTLAATLKAAGKPHEAEKLLSSLKPRQHQTRKTRR
ncbi:FxSxx-COOH system tetratricopeptide repeat protein [Streptomyces sp. HPF1205]|uniref:FxSxx-COOH system tetratricopeptide repeat protein n=1 Tax=Streptomyces sp. HPF1205 TaxID=2873262 RepID=UPI001CECA995|nr:FxSxx-COOH system tetratricopeptide repeat protein [Streptomyces sp. HPF1205]